MAKYGVFSTSDVVHYLQVNHRRLALTDREAEAVLMLMPEVEHVGPRRWRYDPGHISEDEKGIIRLLAMCGTVPAHILQDKYGQAAVAMAEDNGSISMDEEEAWLTDLGQKRADALQGVSA
jgi:hypothetical protein